MTILFTIPKKYAKKVIGIIHKFSSIQKNATYLYLSNLKERRSLVYWWMQEAIKCHIISPRDIYIDDSPKNKLVTDRKKLPRYISKLY